MEHILETERLYLREYVEEDFAPLHDIFSDAETMSYYPSPFTIDQTESWITRNLERYQNDGYGLWAVCLKENGFVIGDCGHSNAIINGHKEEEIGYHINKSYWSKGYATEAALKCKEYAFNILKLNKVISIIDPNNQQSIRVAEKTGLKLERQEHIFNKKHLIYSAENIKLDVCPNCENQFTTDRLLIRMPKPGDGRIVYEAIEASIEQLKPWLPFARMEQSEHNTEANIREAQLKFMKREDLRLHIFLRDTNQFVGSSGLHNPNWDVPKFEIGYWIDTRLSGNGYMTEAVQGITNFAFEQLKARRLEIRCDTLNFKSQAIPERLNYSLEGTLRNEDISVDGSRLKDTHIYAKIK